MYPQQDIYVCMYIYLRVQLPVMVGVSIPLPAPLIVSFFLSFKVCPHTEALACLELILQPRLTSDFQ